MSTRQEAVLAALRQAAWVLPGRPTHEEFQGAMRSICGATRLESVSTQVLLDAIDAWAAQAELLIEDPSRRPRSLPGRYAITTLVDTAQKGPEAFTEAVGRPERLVSKRFRECHTAFALWCEVTADKEADPFARAKWQERRDEWFAWLPKERGEVERREALGEDFEAGIRTMIEGRDLADMIPSS